MKAIRVGVIGVGSLGQHHARVFAELAGARLVGVADVDRARAAAIAGRSKRRSCCGLKRLTTTAPDRASLPPRRTASSVPSTASTATTT